MTIRLLTLFALAFLSCFAPVVRPATVEPASLALINGRVWMGSDNARFAEAIAVQGNRILRVGTTNEIKQLVDSSTQVLDLGGRLVTPGFNDAHIHFLSGSLGGSGVDLTNAPTVADIIERIALYARQNANAQWTTGHGWQYSQFPGGLPTKSYLDAVVKDRPVLLIASDGHSAWVNSRALQLAGITHETKFDGYGEIVRNASNEPTGVLKEGAQQLVRRLVPEPTRVRKLNALRFGMMLASRFGITSIQNASSSPDELELYDELLKSGELTVRVSIAFSAGNQTTPQEFARFIELKNQYQSNPMLRANSVKFVLDGVIESHTAATIDRYNDLPVD